MDFLITKDGAPWFMVEVKTSDRSLSPSLAHFQKQTGAQHAFQVVFDLPFEPVDAFSYTEPVVIPVTTLLSQLV